MDQDVNLQEMLTIAMITLTSAARVDTPENLTEISTKETRSLLADKSLQKHIGTWELVWGPVIYSHSDKEKVTADNAMFIIKQEDPTDENIVKYVISIMGTNPISLYGWFKEDFNVSKTVKWSTVLDPADSSDAKGVISEGTYTGMNVQTKIMKYNNLTINDFFKQELTAADKEYHIYVTGHSLGGPMAVTVALWLQDTRPDWDNHTNAVIHIYPFAGATAGNEVFTSYIDSKKGMNFIFPDRYWNQYDVVPHVWYEETIARLPTLYEPEIPPTKIVESMVQWARKLAEGTGYIHINEDSSPLTSAPKSIMEKFLEAIINSSVKEFVKLLDNIIPGKGEIENTLNYILRLCWEHSIAYFELLNMLDILFIMIGNIVFAENLAKMMTDSLIHTIKKFVHPELEEDKIGTKAISGLIIKELKKLIK